MEDVSSTHERAHKKMKGYSCSHVGPAISEVFVHHTSSSIRDSRCIYYELGRGTCVEFRIDDHTQELHIRDCTDQRGQLASYHLLQTFCQKIPLGFSVTWYQEFGICLVSQAMCREFEDGKPFKDGVLPLGIKGLKFLDFAGQSTKMKAAMRNQHVEHFGGVDIIRQDLHLPGQSVIKLDICSASSALEQLACQVFVDPACKTFSDNFVRNVETDWHAFETILVGALRVVNAARGYVDGPERNRVGTRELEVILYHSYLDKTVAMVEQEGGGVASAILFQLTHDNESNSLVQTHPSACLEVHSGQQVSDNSLDLEHIICLADDSSEAMSTVSTDVRTNPQHEYSELHVTNPTFDDTHADEPYNGDAEEDLLTLVPTPKNKKKSKKGNKKKKSEKTKSQTANMDLSSNDSAEHLDPLQTQSDTATTSSNVINSKMPLNVSDLPTIPEDEAVSAHSEDNTTPADSTTIMTRLATNMTIEDSSSVDIPSNHHSTQNKKGSHQLSATAKAFAPKTSQPAPAATNFKFDDMHNKLLKCFHANCRKMTNCWDPDVRACPSCGPESFVRYCSMTCLLDNLTAHLLTHCPMKPLPFTIDRTTIRPSQLPVRPFITAVAPFVETIERYRQATYYAMESDGEYRIFDDIESIEGGTYSRPTPAEMQSARGSKRVPVYTTNFGSDMSASSRKRRFQSLLETILAYGGRQREVCIDAFAMIKQNLEEHEQWNEDMCTYLVMQVGFEWHFHQVPLPMQCFDSN